MELRAQCCVAAVLPQVEGNLVWVHLAMETDDYVIVLTDCQSCFTSQMSCPPRQSNEAHIQVSP